MNTTKAADVQGEPLFAEYAGIRFTTSTFINRRMQCRSYDAAKGAPCNARFLPYMVLPEGATPGLTYKGEPDTLLARNEYGRPITINEALDACPVCGGKGRWVGAWAEWSHVNGKLGRTICDADCVRATGADCKCSCAGANHGSMA